MWERPRRRDCRDTKVPSTLRLRFPVASHQLEKPQGIADGMNAADFVRIHGGNWHRRNSKTFLAGQEQHFSFIIEPVSPGEHRWNEIAVEHAKTALSIRNLLPAHGADFFAHV